MCLQHAFVGLRKLPAERKLMVSVYYLSLALSEKSHQKKGESQMAPHLEKTEKREGCASFASYRTPAWAVPERKQRSAHCSRPLVLSHFTSPLPFLQPMGKNTNSFIGSPSPSTHTTGPGAARSSEPKPRHSRFLQVMATDANQGSMCSVENPRQLGYS